MRSSSPVRTLLAASRRSVTAAAFGLALSESPDARADTPPEPPTTATASSGSYRLPLAAGYVLAPALAGLVGHGLFELTNTDDDDYYTRRNVAIAVGSLMFTLPAAVHLYHDGPGRALRSFGTMLGVTLVGGAVFGGLGYLIGKGSCEETEAEGCGVHTESLTLIGAATGATLAYVGHAIYDVSSNAELPARDAARPDAATRLQLWLVPLAEAPRADVPRLTGMQLGGALRF